MGGARRIGAGSSAVRISAGLWKAKKLEVPPAARPTSARAREALFDILQRRIPGARVLDLYAGSGAVGLEAVSRGASHAVLVELQDAALRRNLERLAPDAGVVEVLAVEALAAVGNLERRGERFDVVFADPPYGEKLPTRVFDVIERLLTDDGIFVLQHDVPSENLPAPSGLRPSGDRIYGRNGLRFFEREVTVF